MSGARRAFIAQLLTPRVRCTGIHVRREHVQDTQKQATTKSKLVRRANRYYVPAILVPPACLCSYACAPVLLPLLAAMMSKAQR